MRAFIAISIPEDIKERIHELQRKLPDRNLKIVAKENLHITLKFLGNIDEQMLENISSKLINLIKTKNIKPFKVKIAGIGFFPNEKFIRVVWIDCKSNELKILGDRISKSLTGLGFSPEEFKSHLTIARVKGRTDLEDFFKSYKNEELGSFIVKDIVIYKSELTSKGPIYTEKLRLRLIDS